MNWFVPLAVNGCQSEGTRAHSLEFFGRQSLHSRARLLSGRVCVARVTRAGSTAHIHSWRQRLVRTYHLPDAAVSAVCELTHLILRTNLSCRDSYYPHVTCEGTVVLLGAVPQISVCLFVSKYMLSSHFPAHFEVRCNYASCFDQKNVSVGAMRQKL